MDHFIIEEFKEIKGSEMEAATDLLKKFKTLDEIFENKFVQDINTQKIISVIEKLKVENFFLHHSKENENFGFPIWSSLI